LLNAAQNSFLIAVWVTLSITCLLLLNRFWAPARRRAHNDVIGWQISILGTIYAVMIGFMLYAVWANFQTAETNADNEANALVNLFRTADGLPEAQRSAIQIAAANYADEVLTKEWVTMSRGDLAHSGQLFIMQLWAVTTHTPVQTPSQQISLAQAMTELSQLTEHRRVRLLESRSKMPTVLWTVLVIGGIITIGSCCLIGSENTGLHFSLILALSLLISMALVAISDIDRPFQGAVHVSRYAFLKAQGTMLTPEAIPK
jgi:hypothetical protein